MQTDQKVQDAVSGSWVDTKAPQSWRPYLRLSRFDRPVGAWLLFLPCAFGAFLAGGEFAASLFAVAHFLIVNALGAWLMRGAGCTWNDIVDRKIDAQVERTKSRPLPSGAVSLRGALIWMVIQALIAGAALLSFAPMAIWVAIASLAIVALYPFAKRFTNWPQFVLGLAFNWGIFVAYAQLGGAIRPSALMLYVAAICWTIYYDTIYAYQDIRDDQKIGVKSTARRLQSRPATYLTIFAVSSALFALIAVLQSGLSFFSLLVYVLGVFAFLISMILQIRQFDFGNTELCLAQFRGNVQIGQVMALIWAAGYFLVIGF